MDLTQLRYFLAVAEHGSISGAARVLDIRQPTLSVAIKNLEEELGGTLLHRDARGVSLTSSGQVVLEEAREALQTLERMRARLEGLESGTVGSFEVGCNESLGAYFMPELIRTFIEAHPQIEVSIWNGSSDLVRQRVIDRRLDFGICVNPQPHDDLVIVKLFRDGVEVYVSAEEPEPKTTMDALARIRRGPLVGARRMVQVQDLIARFESDEVMPARFIDCGDLHMVRSLIGRGVGVGLLPRRVAHTEGPGKLRKLHRKLPAYPDMISLLYRGDLHRTRAAMVLKEVLVEHGRSLRVDDPREGSILPPE
ncbi:MAG: LysR family transcriptional regulator [Myxococcota bacterium]